MLVVRDPLSIALFEMQAAAGHMNHLLIDFTDQVQGAHNPRPGFLGTLNKMEPLGRHEGVIVHEYDVLRGDFAQRDIASLIRRHESIDVDQSEPMFVRRVLEIASNGTRRPGAYVHELEWLGRLSVEVLEELRQAEPFPRYDRHGDIEWRHGSS